MTDLTEREIDQKLRILNRPLLHCTEGIKEVRFIVRHLAFGQSVHVRVRTVPNFSKVRRKIIQDCIDKWARKYEIEKYTFKIDDKFPYSHSQD